MTTFEELANAPSNDLESQVRALRQPPKPSEVRFRILRDKGDKACVASCYINARWVNDRLDGAVGPENWQMSMRYMPGEAWVEERERNNRKYETRHQAGVWLCRLGIRFAGTTEWVWREDCAEQKTPASEAREKGGASDAFKRAAVHFGVAKDLYAFGEQLNDEWIDTEPAYPGAYSKKITAGGLAKCAGLYQNYFDSTFDWAGQEPVPAPKQKAPAPQADYEALKEGIEKATNLIALNKIGKSISLVKDELPQEALDSLRELYEERKTAMAKDDEALFA